MRLAALALTLFFAIPPSAIQVTDVVWKDGPPTLPKGTKVAVLEGDPKAPGIFTMRLRVPAGSVVEPHTHPRAERVTILSGEVRVGFGDQFNDSELKAFGPGGFYVNPPDSHHFVFFAKESVIQITGEGPWEIHYLQQ